MPRKRNQTINKKELVERLYRKLDKQITKGLLWDCVTYTFAWVAEQILKNKSVSIKNFASFSIKKKILANSLLNQSFEFFMPKIYSQPILRKVVKYTLKTRKENQGK